MTTDLSSKTVKELRKWAKQHLSPCSGKALDVWCEAFDELARRLEEAQQQIVAQQVYIWDLFSIAEHGGNIFTKAKFPSLETLAAHDAEVAAKAKAEALEERADVYDAEPYPESEYYAIDLRAKAAEYRAKATEAGRNG